MSRSPSSLQDHHYHGQPEKIRTIPVSLISSSYLISSWFTESLDNSDSVEAKHNFASKGLPRGNENRRWHGTRRKCKLGDKGVKNFCGDSDCSLCRIVKTSLDLKYFKEATGWGRFGEGIYTSSTSSKFVPPNESLLKMHLTLRFHRLGPMTIRKTGLLPSGRRCF